MEPAKEYDNGDIDRDVTSKGDVNFDESRSWATAPQVSVHHGHENDNEIPDNIADGHVASISEQNLNGSDDVHLINPQDATLHIDHTGAIDFPVTIHNDSESRDDTSTIVDSVVPMDIGGNQQIVPQLSGISDSKLPLKIKRRTRKRSRIANIDERRELDSSLPPPSNQYECILIRRAILPIVPGVAIDPQYIEVRNGYSVYGDIALGMKLSIADTGQVIVQRVTPLADGRASPAQLTGVIQRGDILLSIDGVSLAENALVGLKPLQAPDDPNVPCQRQYKLRFSARSGLEMLKSIESQQAIADFDATMKIPSEMLGLFPMVDQLSGMPLFEELLEHDKDTKILVAPESQESTSNDSIINLALARRKPTLPLDIQISENLALQRRSDRFQIENGDDEGNFKKPFASQTVHSVRSIPERQEQGRQIVIEALNLIKQAENIDAGKDVRSFQSWNSTLSQYSRASVRRRRVFDAASLPSKNFGRLVEEIEEKEEDNDDDDSVASGKSSENSNSVDGDELLVRLAAHDEIWRKQVIEFLENVALESDNVHSSSVEREKDSPKDINSAMSKELGNFLFGENMAKILSTNRTPRTLPSEEVTAVLFDLATKLSASVPDVIKASGTILSSKSELTPIKELKRYGVDSDIFLASRFLLEHALPVWLKSFRPLVWEHRRILWPSNRVHIGGSMASSLSDDDGLSVDTSNKSLHSTVTRQHRRKKSIQEIIEDQELDVETRGEACFLVTFYFINELLPRLMNSSHIEDNESIQEEITIFMKDYGSYLRMDTCLAYASVLKATTVIDLLLSIAKHDPRHREAIKQISKSTSMVFYEPSIMSAVLQKLHGILKETTFERQQTIIDLCAAAYPDIRPWQVKSACCENDTRNDLYYLYLSHLLHPTDGHDSARRDALLVKEWCELSLKDFVAAGINGDSDRRDNFLVVASRHSSYHLLYHRDLVFLLTQSMNISEHQLALDLVNEVMESPSLSSLHSTIDLIVNSVRQIAKSALDSDDNQQNFIQIIRRVIRIYSKPYFRKHIDVPKELLLLIKHKAGSVTKQWTSDPKVLTFLQFLIDEAIPDDLLKALAIGETTLINQPEFLPLIKKLLIRGALLGTEMSSSLLRIRRARQRLQQPDIIPTKAENTDQIPNCSVWTSMAAGAVTLDK